MLIEPFIVSNQQGLDLYKIYFKRLMSAQPGPWKHVKEQDKTRWTPQLTLLIFDVCSDADRHSAEYCFCERLILMLIILQVC